MTFLKSDDIQLLANLSQFLVVPLKNQRLAEMQVVFLFQSALTATLRESNGAGFAVHTVHIRKTGRSEDRGVKTVTNGPRHQLFRRCSGCFRCFIQQFFYFCIF